MHRAGSLSTRYTTYNNVGRTYSRWKGQSGVWHICGAYFIALQHQPFTGIAARNEEHENLEREGKYNASPPIF